MIVQIELLDGPYHVEPTAESFDKNIAALHRAIEGKTLSVNDVCALIDTKSIIEAIKRKVA